MENYNLKMPSLFDEGEIEIDEKYVEVLSKEKELILNERYKQADEYLKKRMRILNIHLLPKDTSAEGVFQIPEVMPYRGKIPEVFVPYSSRVQHDSLEKGVYCHIDDYRFHSTWTQPLRALHRVRRYMLAVAPDFTLWVDGLVCENVEQIRRSRTIQRFWQNNGVHTIQTASWGDAESIRIYAFDGLAENSWTAIGHQRIGSLCEQRLFQYGLSALVEKKNPCGLLVFGFPLDFDPGVPVIVKSSHISIYNFHSKHVI